MTTTEKIHVNDICKLDNMIGAYCYFSKLDDCKEETLLDVLKNTLTTNNPTLKKHVVRFNLAELEKEYFDKEVYQYTCPCTNKTCAKFKSCDVDNRCEPRNWWRYISKKDYEGYYSTLPHKYVTRKTTIKVFRYKYHWNEQAINDFESKVKAIIALVKEL